jgi:hypothetical protein
MPQYSKLPLHVRALDGLGLAALACAAACILSYVFIVDVDTGAVFMRGFFSAFAISIVVFAVARIIELFELCFPRRQGVIGESIGYGDRRGRGKGDSAPVPDVK